MTTIYVYNWSGLTVELTSSMSRPPTFTCPPNGTVARSWVLTTASYPGITVPVGIRVGEATYVGYTVVLDSQSHANLIILSNNQIPLRDQMNCTGNYAGATNCNNYAYSNGYDQANTYLVQGVYYSRATNRTFASGTMIVEVPGNDYTGLQLVDDAFHPTAGGESPSGGGGGSGGTSPPPPSGCSTCTVCSTCPDCPQCQEETPEDESSTWYWWVLGAVLVILLVLLLGAGVWVWWRRRAADPEAAAVE